MARGTPTAIPTIVSLFGVAVGGRRWAKLAKLVGTVLEVCNSFDVKEPVRPITEVLEVAAMVDSAVGVAVLVELEKRGLVDSVGIDNDNVVTVADCPALSIAANGYGSSEVVRPCPAAPAQHSLLPLGSQRLTSSKLSNWPLRCYSSPAMMAVSWHYLAWMTGKSMRSEERKKQAAFFGASSPTADTPYLSQ